MYRQQTLDLDRVRESIDKMFPKSKPDLVRSKRLAPKPLGKPSGAVDWTAIEVIGLAKIPEYHRGKRYHRDILRWLGSEPTAKGKPVTAHRVYQPLNTFHGGIDFSPDMRIPSETDPYRWADAYCRENGLCMELRNGAGEAVYKTTPPSNTAKTFI